MPINFHVNVHRVHTDRETGDHIYLAEHVQTEVKRFQGDKAVATIVTSEYFRVETSDIRMADGTKIGERVDFVTRAEAPDVSGVYDAIKKEVRRRREEIAEGEYHARN